MFVPFEIGKSYNFETWAPSLIGAQYKAALVMAIMDYNTAIKERDVTAAHKSIYGYLPPGTPNDAAATPYIRIKLPSGIVTILALTWIKENTIELVDSGQIHVTVSDVAPSDVTKIRDQLVLAGYNNFNIEYVPGNTGD